MFISFDFRVMVALRKFVYSFKYESQLEQVYNNSTVRWITTILPISFKVKQSFKSCMQ